MAGPSGTTIGPGKPLPNMEKTGRWTDDEHTRFLHGLELFGKKWTKVADVVGSRTTVQVRSHAQKYFQKLEKDRAQPGGGGAARAGGRPGALGGGGYDDAGFGADAPPVAVPLALRKFLPAGAGADGRAGPADVAAGLFKFLSPLVLPSAAREPPEASKVNEMARRIFDDAPAGGDGGVAARSRPRPPPVVPEWYRSGGRIEELLRDAAGVEWKDDDGGAPLRDPPAYGGARPPPDAAAAKPERPAPLPTAGVECPSSAPGFARRPSAQWAAHLAHGKRRRDDSPGPHEATGDRRGSGTLPRFSSLDALYNASMVVDGKRPRTTSQGSEGDVGFEDGIFYDDAPVF